jgi:hypothetical protein
VFTVILAEAESTRGDLIKVTQIPVEPVNQGPGLESRYVHLFVTPQEIAVDGRASCRSELGR